MSHHITPRRASEKVCVYMPFERQPQPRRRRWSAVRCSCGTPVICCDTAYLHVQAMERTKAIQFPTPDTAIMDTAMARKLYNESCIGLNSPFLPMTRAWDVGQDHACCLAGVTSGIRVWPMDFSGRQHWSSACRAHTQTHTPT